MHLLNVRTLKTEDFEGDGVPAYAILSHTWGDDEMTYQQIQCSGLEKKAGYLKVLKSCDVAKAYGFDYIWIDTCCIDKTSSAELSEAINSMYRWYREATVCFAYLSDMPPRKDISKDQDDAFVDCLWFRRGWTLQELIAPPIVVFFDRDWQELGTKSTLQDVLHGHTGIPSNILLRGELKRANVAQKMSWAAQRETTRIEDRAYSLMGIFGVNMPLLYGEGPRAFIRLQEEILRTTADYSIFAWTPSRLDRATALASSPKAFSCSGDVVSKNAWIFGDEAITVNSLGIHLEAKIIDDKDSMFDKLVVLPCKLRERYVAIVVRRLSSSNSFFRRVHTNELQEVDSERLDKVKARKVCIHQEHQVLDGVPLMLSAPAVDGKIDLVKLLLTSAGRSDLASRQNEIQTALHLAVAGGHEDVARVLIEHKADVNGKPPKSSKPWDGFLKRLKVTSRSLTATGVDLMYAGTNDAAFEYWHDRTPLQRAIECGHDSVVKVLIEKGADLERKTARGATPLWLAILWKRKTILRLLFDSR